MVFYVAGNIISHILRSRVGGVLMLYVPVKIILLLSRRSSVLGGFKWSRVMVFYADG